MSVILSQKNSRAGQGLGSRNTNRAFQGSMDEVRFARTRKIELGRLSGIRRLSNSVQVAWVREARIMGAELAGYILGIGERARELGSTNSSNISELF